MAKVLNHALYVRLRRAYGTVKVSNQGEAMRHRATFTADRKRRIAIATDGEYYAICCPFCNDTRYRMYVNHMWGQYDGHGRRMTFLATCFNEHCLDREKNFEKFVERIDDNGMLGAVEVKKGVIVTVAPEVEWPGECVPINQLKDRHTCRQYLRSRQFDPDDIAEKYDVRFCEDSYYTFARQRLIIPIYEGKLLKGWQARYVGELAWKNKELKNELPPKYFSCPRARFRSMCVYGLDQMRRWHTGIIVEGPTDRWRVGAMSGCIFGNTITQAQRKKLLREFAGRDADRALVLLLDPEEFNSKTTRETVIEFKRQMLGRFCAVKLPDGSDPGKLNREFLREYIRGEAAEQGIKVEYRKVLP